MQQMHINQENLNLEAIVNSAKDFTFFFHIKITLSKDDIQNKTLFKRRIRLSQAGWHDHLRITLDVDYILRSKHTYAFKPLTMNLLDLHHYVLDLRCLAC